VHVNGNGRVRGVVRRILVEVEVDNLTRMRPVYVAKNLVLESTYDAKKSKKI
jgi:hypothetical protein